MVISLRNIFVYTVLTYLSCTNLFAIRADSVLAQSKESQIYSDLNKEKSNFNSDDFTFLVTGHIHGSSNSQSGMPAASIMANMNLFQSPKVDFIVSLGDLFLNVERDYKNYENYFLNKIKAPFFNAVGNHDVDNDLYKKRYGKTFETFDIGPNRFLIIDSELNNGDIVGQQKEMVLNALAKNTNIKNVFIFMHRTLWAEDDEALSELFQGNTRSAVSTNFSTEILPAIEGASKYFQFYIFSGSMGGNAPSSFLYHNYSDKIKFIATAIRDLPRDAVLQVNCINGKVFFKTVSLNTNKVLPLEKYTVSWWKNNMPQPPGFNWRLVPLYIWQMITHRFFWYGVFYMLIPMIILYFLIRRKYRAKKA